MGTSLIHLSVSGIYGCYCGNLETHINGKLKAPCSSCGRNSSWTLIVGTEELEKALSSNFPYTDTQNLTNTILNRFKLRSI